MAKAGLRLAPVIPCLAFLPIAAPVFIFLAIAMFFKDYNTADEIVKKKRGHALFVIGSKRLHVNFEIPLYKFDYFGNAGGR